MDGFQMSPEMEMSNKGFQMTKHMDTKKQIEKFPFFIQLQEGLTQIWEDSSYQFDQQENLKVLNDLFDKYISIIRSQKEIFNKPVQNFFQALIQGRHQKYNPKQFYDLIKGQYTLHKGKSIANRLFKKYDLLMKLESFINSNQKKDEFCLNPLIENMDRLFKLVKDSYEKCDILLYEQTIVNSLFTKPQNANSQQQKQTTNFEESLLIRINSIKSIEQFDQIIIIAQQSKKEYLRLLQQIVNEVINQMEIGHQAQNNLIDQMNSIYFYQQTSTIYIQPVQMNKFNTLQSSQDLLDNSIDLASTQNTYSQRDLLSNSKNQQLSKRNSDILQEDFQAPAHKDIIIWIDQNIKAEYNRRNLRRLKQEFPLQEIHGYDNFEDFLQLIELKRRKEAKEADFLMEQSIILQKNRFNTDQNLNNQMSMLQSVISQVPDELDDDMCKSYQYQLKYCKELEKESNQTPTIAFYLIMSGKMAVQVINRLPSEIKNISIFCNNVGTYAYQFDNDRRISTISNRFSSLLNNLSKQIFHENIVYNCLFEDLKTVFKNKNYIFYLSISSYCAHSVKQKSTEKLKQIIKNIKKCFHKDSKIQTTKQSFEDRIIKEIQNSFTSVQAVINLYTKTSTFQFFINYLMCRLNENVLQEAKYLIKTMRYALAEYQDNSLHLFQDSNFRLYRGLRLDVDQFKKDYPIESMFITFVFSSSSTNIDITKNFAKPGGLILEISFKILNLDNFEKCRPKNISEESKFQGEMEVLFNCFSTFVVKGYRQYLCYTICELEFIENPLK